MLVSQHVVLILGSSAILLLAGLSALLRYVTQRFFDVSLAACFSMGAYGVLFFHELHAVSLPLSIALSILMTSLVGVVLEAWLYKPLRKTGVAPWMLLVVSLGVYIVIENLIAIAFSDAIRTIRSPVISISHRIGDAFVSDSELMIIATSVGTVIAVLLFLQTSSLGRAIRGVSSDPELCKIFGIDAEWVRLWSVGISSGIGAVTGILVAMDTDMTPTMGFPLLMSGVVVMIVGGIGSFGGLVSSALIIGAVREQAAYYLGSSWMDSAAFFVLIAFLIWRPLGFSGRRLRKVEI